MTLSDEKADKIIALLERIANNGTSLVSSCSYTIGEWAVEWLTTYKKDKLRPTTYEKYDRLISNYVLALFGDMLLANPNCISLQKIFNNIPYERAKEHLLAICKEMCEKAINLGYISRNPFANIELPKHHKENGKALTTDEERAFVSACSFSICSDYFLLLLFTGMRRGEGLALTRADIDFERRTISVSKTMTRNGVGSPKTQAGVRIVPIMDCLMPILLKYKDLPGDVRLFTFQETTVQRHMKKVLAIAKITTPITAHCLRHTFITRCYEKGVDQKTISKWCGHSNTAITYAVYTHCNIDHEQKQIEKLNKEVGGS